MEQEVILKKGYEVMSKKETKEVVTEETKEISPAEYFELVKSKIKPETEENVELLYNTTMTKLKKYMITGQVKAAKELYARCIYLEKEMKLVRKGFDRYVLREDIDKYIEEIAGRCVCIIEMKNFDREIPDDIVDKVAETADIFDEFFVVFTDYTGEARSKVAKERREKDPIIFGNIFVDGLVSPKMYFIGDWIDEYCDLTLDKMIEEIAKNDKTSSNPIVYNIDDYSTLDSIEEALFNSTKRKDKRESAVIEDKKSAKMKKGKLIPKIPKKRGRPRKKVDIEE